MEKFQISVRGLVEFVYRSGDLDTRFQGSSKMLEGQKIHQKIQKSQGSDYRSEVSLQKTVQLVGDDGRCYDLLINGRADGILTTETGIVVDEIKGVSQFLETITEETFPLHWAQVKLYGAILCEDLGLDSIDVQLTYAQFETNEIKRIRVSKTAKELMEFLLDTAERYKKWLIFKYDWTQLRRVSLDALPFPFTDYRKGQRQLAISIYNTIKDSGILYSEAPTGTGKTMSTLFPAVKAMSQGFVEKIFYLSAKTITKVVAEDAVKLMREVSETPFHFKSVTLTAKDKICLNDVVACYPDKCPYAKRYFDKSLDALWEVINCEDVLSKEVIQQYAEKYKICPYEFSLDCSLFMDLIICDYNYAFDPRVYLRRFFEFPIEDYVFLVDEAHNLVDRSRTMYSAELNKEKFYEVKKQIAETDKALKKAFDGINKMFLEVRKRCDESGVYVHEDEVSEVFEQIKKRMPVLEKWLGENHQALYYEAVLDAYFDLVGYLRISELYDNGYVTYLVNGTQSDTKIKLFCVNPSNQIRRFLQNSRATIFFSATLSPLEYYTTLLTGAAPYKVLCLPSPFDPNNRKVLFSSDISVKYKDREDSIASIVETIRTMATSKLGNYLVFFPSYAYMQQVYTVFSLLYEETFDLLLQSRELTDDEKVEFLGNFETHRAKREDPDQDARSLIAFAVIGGHFSEGVDLKGDLLIGVLIVGVGLPMISFENDLIKHYFDYEMNRGYEFAYQFPGMNKVLQSAGRVIRSETDRGVIVLLDKRYESFSYRRILPKDWGFQAIQKGKLQQVLNEFWENDSTVEEL